MVLINRVKKKKKANHTQGRAGDTLICVNSSLVLWLRSLKLKSALGGLNEKEMCGMHNMA